MSRRRKKTWYAACFAWLFPVVCLVPLISPRSSPEPLLHLSLRFCIFVPVLVVHVYIVAHTTCSLPEEINQRHSCHALSLASRVSRGADAIREAKCRVQIGASFQCLGPDPSPPKKATWLPFSAHHTEPLPLQMAESPICGTDLHTISNPFPSLKWYLYLNVAFALLCALFAPLSAGG